MEITPTVKEIRDVIDTIGMWCETRFRKEEGILISNKPTGKEIMDFLDLKQIDWVHASSDAFRDLYNQFGHTSFYLIFNKEFKPY